MKQYTFKDGTKIVASSIEEAKAKHKNVSNRVIAFRDSEGLEYNLTNLKNEIEGFLKFINLTLKLLDKFEEKGKCKYQYSSDFTSEKAEFDIKVVRKSDNEIVNYAYVLSKGLKSELRTYRYFGVTTKEIPSIIKDIENFLK